MKRPHLEKPITRIIAGKVKVALYGKKSTPPYLRAIACLHGASPDKICVIKSPSDALQPGYQVIAAPTFESLDKIGPDLFAEGVWLIEPRSAAIIRTADCPTIVMYDAKQRKLIITHAGRAALTPTNKPGESLRNIVTIAHEALTGGATDTDIHVYITGAICGHCFVHDQPGAERFIAPFDQFGSEVFIDRSRGALDLKAVIKKQFVGLGVDPEQITNDGLCTHERTDLFSYRRDRTTGRNTIVTVLT